MKRCPWCNLANPLYVKYHDEEWGRLNLDEHYLFEMLILESFQAGLSGGNTERDIPVCQPFCSGRRQFL